LPAARVEREVAVRAVVVRVAASLAVEVSVAEV